jgi:hypothetical protein
MSRLLPAAVALLLVSPLAAQVAAPDIQIAGAVSAAPEGLRGAATVIGYRNYHRMMICLADDPSAGSWHVACYHKDLEPFMARGRELEAAGMDRSAIDSIRLAEIKSGVLRMPDGPRMLYNLFAPADSVDASAGTARGPTRLQVVYIPYATPESTGLPARPADGLPWLMYPGKPWAHIMIMSR